MTSIDRVTHIGITVASLARSVDFYVDNFGFRPHRTNQFGEAFFENNRSLYQLPPGTTCDTAVLVAPDGTQLELFEFSSAQAQQLVPWNRAGITHLAFATDDVNALAAQMKKNGATFCMEVGTRPDGGRWVFVRDPDGNLVEVMEPFKADQQM